MLRLSREPGRQSCSSGQPDYCCSALALPAAGAAQTTPAPPVITRTLVAATKLPTVTDVPLHCQRHPLPDVGIERGLARWRGQNAQRRRGAVHRRRKDRDANGGQRTAIDFPPLLPCSCYGLGSACGDGTCRRQRVISHSESDPRPETRRL
jgi:hypothetical protein